MPPSLSSKLRDLRRSLKSKVKPFMLFDFDHLKLLARHMPRTGDEMCKLIPESFVAAYGDKILFVTINHERDQSQFEECVQEINAFLRGGLPGMAVLERVYTQILKHFEMETDMEEVMDACKIYVHAEQNRLKRKRPLLSDEERDEIYNPSQV
jgi:hypothetical protein